jgi:ribosomal protein L11 methyltransferase
VRTCLQVDVGPAAGDAELAADALWQLGALAIEQQPARLVAGFTDDDAVLAAYAAVAARWPSQVVELDAGWRDVLRSPARTVDVGRGVAVDIDPGRVFGNGDHPTTRGALDALASVVRAGDRVLDVGCGSGVLAVAAARLGASSVVAVDVDVEAVEVTRANAHRNGVGEVVDASTTPLAGVPGPPFDVVAANLGGRLVIEELARDLAACTARVLVVGGLLDDGRPPPAVDGFAPERIIAGDGWTTVVYRCH